VPLLGIGIGGALILDYHGYIETVPFTNRTHIVLRTPLQEREHSETRFACLKEKHASIILDPHHPDCVRLNNITSKLVRAVHTHLIIKSHDTAMLELDRGNAASVVEVLRKKLGSAGRAQPATGHLDGLNWEVMVVEDKRVNMWCYPAGKIVVPTGFLEVFRTDAEIATMIAHEVGLFAQWADACVLWGCSPENF
jgi:predicted Zn-dependent protease